MERSITTFISGRLDRPVIRSLSGAGPPKDFFTILLIKAPAQLQFIGPGGTCGNSGPVAKEGYFCAFSSRFMPGRLGNRLSRLSVFGNGKRTVIALNEVQASEAGRIFELLLAEHGSKYHHKMDLIRNYVVQIIHFGLKNADSSC